MTEETAKDVAKAAIKVKTKNLTPKQWSEAEAIWSSGAMTRKTIAEKFGVTENTVRRHMAKYDIERASKVPAHKERVEEALAKNAVDDATIMATRIRETKEDHYKMAAALGKLTWQEVLKAKQKSEPVSTALGNLKALEVAIGNLKKIREERYSILGLDKDTFVDEEGLPDLVISELTADQIAALKARDHTEFDDIPATEDKDDDGDNEVVEE
jgi:predicted transcriptional regulator